MSDKDKKELEWLKELKEQIAELQADVALSKEEKTVLHQMLEMLEELGSSVVQPSSLHLGVFLSLSLMAGWRLGFLPSESLASLRRGVPCETDFWLGCISYFMQKEDYPWEAGEAEKTKDFFERALKDASLPRKMRVASLQLKTWCHMALWKFSEALMTLTELKQVMFTSEGKEQVNYLIAYVGRLQDNYLGVEEEDPQYVRILGEQTLLLKEQGELYRHATKFVFLPDAEFGEFLPEESGKPAPLKGSALLKDLESTPNLIDTLAGKIKTPILLALWKAKEEIISRIPITHTLEATREMLLREYGDWVNKLANQGALINAEFLYKALSARSWGEVIIGYANTVEAEIKAKLLPRLENLLMEKGSTLENILLSQVESGGSALGYAERVLKRIATNLLSGLPKDTVSFLLSELPDSLARLRNLRNLSAHGNIVGNAKEIRKLVLGTPEKAGLLKRLTEINL